MRVWWVSSVAAEECYELDFQMKANLKMAAAFPSYSVKNETLGRSFHQQRKGPIFSLKPLEAAHPSRMDSLQQYRLSNFCLVTESFTFMAGTQSFPALDSWYSLEGREREVEALDFHVVRVVFSQKLTCERQWHSPLRCPWSSWIHLDISCTSSVSGPLHHQGSDG